jgi:hypothetical protein
MSQVLHIRPSKCFYLPIIFVQIYLCHEDYLIYVLMQTLHIEAILSLL